MMLNDFKWLLFMSKAPDVNQIKDIYKKTDQ